MNSTVLKLALLAAALMLPSFVLADERSEAAEMAEKLANPTSAVGQLANNFDFTEFEGNLPEANNQRGWSYSFQPVLPFPQKSGKNLILRPAIPIVFKQPVFDTASGEFSDEFALGDVGFDFVYGGTSKSGLVTSYGIVGSIPTATDDAIGADQWTLGPEVLVGVAKKWGIVGVLVGHRWDVLGNDERETNLTSGQYFYSFPILDRTWQIGAGPAWSYNHELTGEKWTVPVGIGINKTLTLNGKTWKIHAQYWNYVKTPDAFGPDEQIRFSITKVVDLPWSKS